MGEGGVMGVGRLWPAEVWIILDAFRESLGEREYERLAKRIERRVRRELLKAGMRD